MQRDFKGVWIPKEIYNSKDLSWSEKILIVEVYNLDSGEGCFASNKYLSDILMMSEGSLANMIVKMISKGYMIKRGFDGRRRYISLAPELIKMFTQTTQNYEPSLNKNMNPELIKILKQDSQKNEHNNIDNNKFNNKVYNLQKSKKDEITNLFSENLRDAVNKFFEYRIEIKKPFKSQKAIDAKILQFMNQVKEFGEIAVIESIESSIANQYQGTFIDKKYLQSNTQKQIKDEKGNYSNTKQGREQFISNIRERAGNIFLQEE